jgi:two-component system phosphate regulon response regulator PhoB
MRILLAEDDSVLADGLTRSLRQSGYAIDCVKNGQDADTALSTQEFDLLILDLGLPRLSGLDVLRRLRARGSLLPVLILTAADSIEQRVNGLDAGADDYITKPFSTQEMLARIRAVLRRRAPEVVTERVEIGELALDTSTHRVTWQGGALKVGPTEFKLLAYLMQHAERVHSRAQLLDKVWGDHVYIEERTVDVHVKRLRESLGAAAPMVETVRGAGYRLTAQVTV